MRIRKFAIVPPLCTLLVLFVLLAWGQGVEDPCDNFVQTVYAHIEGPDIEQPEGLQAVVTTSRRGRECYGQAHREKVLSPYKVSILVRHDETVHPWWRDFRQNYAYKGVSSP